MASAEWVTMAAGATLLDHTHRANHMLVVLDGEIHEDGQVYQAGDTRISAPGDRHFLRFSRDSHCLILEGTMPVPGSGCRRVVRTAALAARLRGVTNPDHAAELVSASHLGRALPCGEPPSWLTALERLRQAYDSVTGSTRALAEPRPCKAHRRSSRYAARLAPTKAEASADRRLRSPRLGTSRRRSTSIPVESVGSLADNGVGGAMAGLGAASPQVKARTAGAFWLMVFVAGSVALSLRGGPWFRAANLIAPVCYVVVTLVLYDLLKPVDRPVSRLAAVFGLLGCAISLLGLTRFIGVRDLVFFGFHCLLVGHLILRATFLPRALGALMVFAGLGWLTFAWRPLATFLSPYNLLPGMIGEGLLITWLLVKGVDEERWTQQAAKALAAVETRRPSKPI